MISCPKCMSAQSGNPVYPELITPVTIRNAKVNMVLGVKMKNKKEQLKQII